MVANDKQIAGDHYKRFKGHEPWDVIQAWGLGYLDGTAVKYLSRWRHKGGIEDLKKSIHFLEKLIEEETRTTIVFNNPSYAPWLAKQKDQTHFPLDWDGMIK